MFCNKSALMNKKPPKVDLQLGRAIEEYENDEKRNSNTSLAYGE
jgi:hypothetical protein